MSGSLCEPSRPNKNSIIKELFAANDKKSERHYLYHPPHILIPDIKARIWLIWIGTEDDVRLKQAPAIEFSNSRNRRKRSKLKS
jgi:hypothetical protein